MGNSLVRESQGNPPLTSAESMNTHTYCYQAGKTNLTFPTLFLLGIIAPEMLLCSKTVQKAAPPHYHALREKKVLLLLDFLLLHDPGKGKPPLNRNPFFPSLLLLYTVKANATLFFFHRSAQTNRNKSHSHRPIHPRPKTHH